MSERWLPVVGYIPFAEDAWGAILFLILRRSRAIGLLCLLYLTITIREGHRIKVYFTQDMLLPAYENHRIAQTF